jgi:CheY-like chemotaxis protein
MTAHLPTRLELPTVLLVEDSDEDVEALRRALSRTGLAMKLVRHWSGDEAYAWLEQEARRSDGSLPHLILLDLNLPGTDGREVLQELKRNSTLASIPVVILTTSLDPHDVLVCYQTGAATYIAKPVNLPSLYATVETLVAYWFRAATLASHQ